MALDKAIADCRGALLITNPEVDRVTLITAKGTRASGTCEWIRKEPNYQRWLGGDIPLLWICGGPGKGKTMLSVFLVEELELRQPVLYYFCANEDEKRNNASAVLRSFLWQVTRIYPDLTQHFLTLLGAGESNATRKTEAYLSSVETLWMAFLKMCHDPKVAELAFILDGLDECDQKSRDWLASRFFDLGRKQDVQNSHPPKVVIVSRDIPRLRLCDKLRLDPDHDGKIDEDVRRFISSRVQELCATDGFEERHKRHVESTLLERSEGTFLWVGFAMAELQAKNTVLEIERGLDELPFGLSALYGRMLRQIATEHTEQITKILQWTALSVHPLSLSELAEAIHCKATRLRSAKEVVRDLVTLCHPFLVIRSQAGLRKSSSADDLPVKSERNAAQTKQNMDEKQTVNLIHQSARDFIGNSDMPAVFRFQRESAHLEMAWRCMDLIQESARSFTEHRGVSHGFNFRREEFYAIVPGSTGMIRDSGSQNSMVEYAAQNWPVHAREASSAAGPLSEHPSGFFDEDSIVRIWWYLKEAKRQRSWDEPPAISDSLQLAAYIGFVPWIEKVFASERSRRPELERKIEWNRKSPLEYAAEMGFGVAWKALLEKGSRLDWRSERFNQFPSTRALVCKFAASGQEMAVRVCIEYDKDLVAADAYGTPLHHAAAGGHHTVVQLLLAAGADCEAKHDGQTALMEAVRRRHSAVVQVLLDFGVERETKNRDGASALHLAARLAEKLPKYLDHHMMRMLLDRGALLDDATALWLAARSGNGVEVRLLLDRGVPADIKIPHCRTPLYCAALEGHDDTVQLLIDRGAKLETIAEAYDLARGQTIMHLVTSKFGQDERFGRIVQLCRSAGANINAVDDEGLTALHLAVIQPWNIEQTTLRIKALVLRGADVNAEDNHGMTTLHRVIERGAPELIVKAFLDLGAEVNARDHRGRTPLHLGAYGWIFDPEPIKWMLDRGADINALDSEGMTPLDHARSLFHDSSTAELLMELGAVEGRRTGTPVSLEHSEPPNAS